MLEHLNPTPRSPSRVVVLGAGGFVGGAIVRRLVADGVAHVAVTRKECDLLGPNAAARLKDLAQPGDSVVLVSAIAPARTPAHVTANVRMGEVVCEALAATPPAHVIYVSSDAVYADDANPVTEGSCGQPSSLHGVMHLAREVMLRTSIQAPVAILRPTLLYGAGDPHNGYGPNRFRRQAARGEPITLFGGGEEMRDHVFIDDVAAIAALTLAHRSRGVLNVATGVSTSFRLVAEMVAQLAPRSVEIKGSPRQNPVAHRHFDVTACLKVFPTFRYTPLVEGLTRAMNDPA
jgi:nucleoside-diphosphate-sugar epimerase